MTPRFFKKEAKKTVFHGLTAWFLYRALDLLESFGPENRSFENLILTFFLSYLGIPALATFGGEDILKRIFGIEIDAELAVNNLIYSTVGACITPFSTRDTSVDISMPLALYTLALYYHYIGGDEFLKLVQAEPREENRPRYPSLN
jgi:hypothetical protein